MKRCCTMMDKLTTQTICDNNILPLEPWIFGNKCSRSPQTKRRWCRVSCDLEQGNAPSIAWTRNRIFLVHRRWNRRHWSSSGNRRTLRIFPKNDNRSLIDCCIHETCLSNLPNASYQRLHQRPTSWSETDNALRWFQHRRTSWVLETRWWVRWFSGSRTGNSFLHRHAEILKEFSEMFVITTATSKRYQKSSDRINKW